MYLFIPLLKYTAAIEAAHHEIIDWTALPLH